MTFQDAAAQMINEALQVGAPAKATIAGLNALYQETSRILR